MAAAGAVAVVATDAVAIAVAADSPSLSPCLSFGMLPLAHSFTVSTFTKYDVGVSASGAFFNSIPAAATITIGTQHSTVNSTRLLIRPRLQSPADKGQPRKGLPNAKAAGCMANWFHLCMVEAPVTTPVFPQSLRGSATLAPKQADTA